MGGGVGVGGGGSTGTGFGASETGGESSQAPSSGSATRQMESRRLMSGQSTADRPGRDLNAAPKVMIAGLLAALAVPNETAEFYADRIIGWRTTPKPTDTANEDAIYRGAGLAYGPRGAPFAHVDELWLVQGLPPAIVERMMPFVTVYSGRQEINVFDAPPQVIAALPGMTPSRLNAFLDRRESAPVDPDSIPRLLGSEQVGATTEGSDAVRVRVRIAFDNGRQAASEVVVLMGADEEPYRVLSWRDDVDPSAAGQRAAQGPR